MSSRKRESYAALLVLFIGLTPFVCGQSSIGSKGKREIKKALTSYVKADDEVGRNRARGIILSHGRPAVAHLLTFAKSKNLSAAAAAIRFQAPKVLGWDLLALKAPAHGPFGSSYYSLGEVALVKRGGKLFGFRVLESPDPDDGVAVIDYWIQDSIDRALDQPGGKSGQLRVTGTVATNLLKPNTGYTERDFALELNGLKASVRFVGPDLLRPHFDGEVSWALSGKKTPKGLYGNRKELYFLREETEAFRKLRGTLVEYLFRVLPGCTPLPLEDAEEIASFAQYQQVQVVLRRTRPEGRIAVLVQLPEYQNSGFETFHMAYLENYCRELLGDAEVQYMVAGGPGPGLEGGVFWIKGSWKRPDVKLKRFLRQCFPTM